MHNYENQQTVMIIDKVFTIRKLLTMQLKNQNFKVVSFNNCRDALNEMIYGDNKISLIILDILIDNSIGKRFLKKIKGNEAFSGIPVIVFSPITARNAVVEFMALGASDFIIKPMTMSPVVLGIIIKKIYKILGKPKPLTQKEVELQTAIQKINFNEEIETPAQKAKIVIQEAESLLALPFAIMKVIKLCSDPKSSVTHIVKPVETDPATAAIILKRANSVAFASRERITSLKQAISRIGFKETRNIATTVSVFELFDKDEHTSGFNKIEFWGHSLASGIIAEALAKVLKFDSKEDAFLAGLLHDIGKMVFDDFLPDEYQKAVDKAFLDNIVLQEAEREVFEMDHTYMGSEISRKWKLPVEISNSIADTHNYDRIVETSKKPKLAGLSLISSVIAKALNIGSSGGVLLEKNVLIVWNKIMTKPVFWKRVIKYVFRNLDDFITMLNLPEEYFRFSMPDDTQGKIALYFPEISALKDLITIAVTKYGYATEFYDEIDKLKEEKDEFKFVFADLTSLDEDKALEVSKSLPENKIVVSMSSKIMDALTIPMDFNEFHSQIDDFLNPEEEEEN